MKEAEPPSVLNTSEDVRAVGGKATLRLVELAKTTTSTYGRAEAELQTQVYLENFGFPSDIYDLSVDRFTAKKLINVDHAAEVEIWLPNRVSIHSKLAKRAIQQLAGRKYDAYLKHQSPTIRFAIDEAELTINDESRGVLRFGFSFAVLAGGLAKVRTYKCESSTKV